MESDWTVKTVKQDGIGGQAADILLDKRSRQRASAPHATLDAVVENIIFTT